jgi:MIP family channel proteins
MHAKRHTGVKRRIILARRAYRILRAGRRWRNLHMTDRSASTASQDRLAPKLVAEFIGTFAFVFIGAGAAAVIGDSRGLAGIGAVALAHGLTIMVFAFAYGGVSGGHFNPAVTIGLLAARGMRLVDAIGYIVAQIAGGIVGALVLRGVLGGTATGLGTPTLAHALHLGTAVVTITPEAGFLIEAMLAFFLVTVVLNTAVSNRSTVFAPLAIGMTVSLNILMGGALTGAPFNPARALGPMVATGNLNDAWLYIAAPIVGGIIAALVHLVLTRMAHEDERAVSTTPAAVTK